MATIQNFEHHSELLQKMSTTLGVDLGQAVLADKLRKFPFRDIVYRCSKCSKVSACERWLADHETGAAEAPDYCRSKYLLEWLRVSD